ncbi:MAG: hypothetical protein ACE5JQ_13765 [Candidatus Methylomirabilales bacterium]
MADRGVLRRERRQVGYGVVLLMGIFALGALTVPTLGEAAGPWKAQIVDQETKKPLGGVVVLAVWYRRYASPGGWAGGGYYGSEEVVTGPDGRFVIPARWTFTFLPFLTTIKGPSFHIFKPGYGQWRFQGADTWEYWERADRASAAWAQLEAGGAVMELPPLRTRKERREFLSYASPPGDVPAASMPRYLETIDGERVFVGFQPLRRRQ